jgi:hypothetical protein
MKKFQSVRAYIVKAERPRMVTILGFLLILQAVFLFGLGIYHFAILSFGPTLLSQWLSGEPSLGGQSLDFQMFIRQLFGQAATQKLLSTLIESLVLFLLTILALVAGIGFLRLWRGSWLLAMFLQGGALLLAIILYLIKKPNHIYLLMLSGIFMVLYLNYADLRIVFGPKSKRENWLQSDRVA